LKLQFGNKNRTNTYLKLMVPTLDALVVEADLVIIRLGTFEGGALSATSSLGARGVPGGVRSLRNAYTCYIKSEEEKE
jgi:hypothetical protein